MDNLLSCDRFEERVQSLMDQRIPLEGDSQLHDHAHDCESCGQVLENFLALEFALNKAFSSAGTEPTSELFVVDGNGTLRRPANSDGVASGFSRENKRVVRWGAAISALMAAVALFLLVPNWLVGEPSVAEDESGGTLVALKSDLESGKVGDGQPGEAQLSSEPQAAVSRFEMVQTLPVSLRNAYGYASELPAVRPLECLECSVNVTIETLQRSFDRFSGEKQIEEAPDLGCFGLGRHLRTV